MLNPQIKLKPDTPENRQAVAASLSALLMRTATPVKYESDGYVTQPVAGVTLPRTHIAEAISTAPGEYDHVLQEPATDVLCNVGELLELGEITWL